MIGEAAPPELKAVPLLNNTICTTTTGAVKSLRLILLEVILTNQFVSLFKQKTKIFVLPKSFLLTNYFFILS